jgi:hypothetical protein
MKTDSRHGGDEEEGEKEEYGAQTSKETVKGTRAVCRVIGFFFYE